MKTLFGPFSKLTALMPLTGFVSELWCKASIGFIDERIDLRTNCSAPPIKAGNSGSVFLYFSVGIEDRQFVIDRIANNSQSAGSRIEDGTIKVEGKNEEEDHGKEGQTDHGKEGQSVGVVIGVAVVSVVVAACGVLVFVVRRWYRKTKAPPPSAEHPQLEPLNIADV
ncbi:hypothetical protein BaRGS_00024585 [Batillaria attramentaria]|uniref:Mid2 domain-containing protein n=1 Tax=Batillaria attramentaria TaxID=370345 RepID=A0ABD0KAV5_9CAEN